MLSMLDAFKSARAWVRSMLGPAEIVFDSSEAAGLPPEIRQEICRILTANSIKIAAIEHPATTENPVSSSSS